MNLEIQTPHIFTTKAWWSSIFFLRRLHPQLHEFATTFYRDTVRSRWRAPVSEGRKASCSNCAAWLQLFLFRSDRNVANAWYGRQDLNKSLESLEKCLSPGRLEPVNDFTQKNVSCATHMRKTAKLVPQPTHTAMSCRLFQSRLFLDDKKL